MIDLLSITKESYLSYPKLQFHVNHYFNGKSPKNVSIRNIDILDFEFLGNLGNYCQLT